MVCINCVIGYAQTYAPYILSLILWFTRGIFKQKPASLVQGKDGGVITPPIWGPWYLPRFVRGLMAMINLGMDEDGFLLAAKATYGDAVYIPWPMKQVFVLSTEPIQHIYSTSSKECFYPIRTRMQHSVFGTSKAVSYSPLVTGTLFPVHAKSLTPLRIPEPTSRFIQEAKKRVEQLAREVDANNGSLDVSFVEWMRATMFAAGTAALFGEDYSNRTLPFNAMENFNKFDEVFGLLASEMIPVSLLKLIPVLKRGIQGEHKILERTYDWIAEGAPGLEEGDVIKAMVDLCNEAGTPPHETATLLFGDFWALQANAPWAAVALLVFVMQSPILQSVLDEIDQLPVDSNGLPELDVAVLDKLEVATSCVHETLRVWTSSFSIRVNPEITLIPVSSSSSLDKDVKYIVEPRTKIICATRASHLTDEIWGDAPQQWDGTRFLNQDGEDHGSREKKLRKVWGFGGGVSICEGRHLATCELKTMLALLLSTFELVPLYATAEDGKTRLSEPITKLDIKGSKNAFAPTRETTRPGLGAIQCKGKSDMVVRVTMRKKL